MSEVSFEQILDKIETSKKDWQKYKIKLKEKEEEIEEIDKKIIEIDEKIKHKNSELKSVDSIKALLIEKASSEFEYDIDYNNKCYSASQKKLKEIISMKNSKIENEIKKKYSEIQTNNENEFLAAEKSLSDIKNIVECSELKCIELDSRISCANEESNRVKLCIPEIEQDYLNVSKNEGFIRDIKSSRVEISEDDAIRNFSSLSEKNIVKIAKKMNSGSYVSSPDYSEGVPILEIVFNMVLFIGMLMKGILKKVFLLYRPLDLIDETISKILYIAAITIALMVFFVSFANGIITILLLILLLVGIVFVAMIGYNIFKFSNKTLRRKLNLDYYTVGYFFKHRKDEILYIIALNYYKNLKEKSPEKLQEIIQTQSDNLETEKQKTQEILLQNKPQLKSAEQAYAEAQEKYENDKKILEIQRKEEEEYRKIELSNEIEEKLKALEKEYKDKNIIIENTKLERENNSEKEAIEDIKCFKQEIESLKTELENSKHKKDSLIVDRQEIIKKIRYIEKENENDVKLFQEADINVVGERSINDKISSSFFMGVTKEIEESINIDKKSINIDKESINIDKESICLYEIKEIIHNMEPIFLVFDGEEEESKIITEKYYKMINSIMCKMLAETYIGAYSFILLDSQENKSNIVQSMPTISKEFDKLEKFNTIKVFTDRTDKRVEEIIDNRENELSGKNIDSLNESNKNMDEMIKYLILSIRVYGEKNGDFNMKNIHKRLKSCGSSNGIIPIILMSKKAFDDSKETLKLPIKELCHDSYYIWDIAATNGYEVCIKDMKFV